MEQDLPQQVGSHVVSLVVAAERRTKRDLMDLMLLTMAQLSNNGLPHLIHCHHEPVFSSLLHIKVLTLHECLGYEATASQYELILIEMQCFSR